jgi:hypothetical protein
MREYIELIRQHIKRDPSGWTLGLADDLPTQLERMEDAIDAGGVRTAKDAAYFAQTYLKEYRSKLDTPAPDGLIVIVQERIDVALNLKEPRAGNL